MAYIAVDIDAVNEAPHVARAAGISEDAALAGLVRLWLRCFREKTDQATDLQLAGVFGASARIGPVLEEFGFLEARESGWRVRGADRYLRLSEARRKGGLKASGNLKRGAEKSPATPPAPAGKQPGVVPTQPRPSHRAPSTEHRA